MRNELVITRTAVVLIFTLLAGCAWTSARVDEQWTHRLTMAPEDAVSCIVSNAARDKYVPKARLLFATETIGVTVQGENKTEDIFSAIVERAGTGSLMTIRTIAPNGNRKDLTQRLTKGC